MKCSHCYADNQSFATICAKCGQAILRLEVCPMGHLLPPGEQDCPICPSMWPEVDSFAGPPLLRGFLLVESGRLTGSQDPVAALTYLEVRDQEIPLALAPLHSGAVSLVDEDDDKIECRILMRPNGISVCQRDQMKKQKAPSVYEPLLPGEKFDLGGVSLRYHEVVPPAWARKLAGCL